MKRLFCGLAVLTLLLETVGQVRSDDFIYWSGSNDGHIWRYNLDGSGQPVPLISGLRDPAGLALDLTGDKMYYGVQGDGAQGSGAIYSANLDGSGSTLLVPGLFQPTEIALDVPGDRMYWAYGSTSATTGGIQSANLNGSDLTTLVSELHDGAVGFALDVACGQMYVGEGAPGAGTIRRYNLDGTGEEILIRDLPRPSAIALDLPGRKMYFNTQGTPNYPLTVNSANLDGSDIKVLVIRPGTGGPGLALDLAGRKIYWSEFHLRNIGRANLDGTEQETLLSGLGPPTKIALQIEVTSQ